MPFEPPPWSANPSQAISLSTGGEIIPVDKMPYYILGRDQEAADIHLNSEKASRNHAAIVHHTDGSVYIIDLKSSHGTFINGQKIPFHKPKLLRKRQKLTFGGCDKEFVVECKGDPEGMGGTVRASHLLVKHKDVRRPSSWKEPVVTRSKEEALAMIEDFHRQLLAGDPSSLGTRFAELAARESHCSSAKRGGDLGQFGPGQMQRPFEEATYALAVGQLSGPVFTDSGVHLILRTE